MVVYSLPKKNIQAYSFVTVNCVNFIIFLCVTLKLFFSQLRAPPRTKSWRRHCKSVVFWIMMTMVNINILFSYINLDDDELWRNFCQIA